MTNVPLPGDVLLLFRTLEGTPVRAAQIRQWTDTDEPQLQPYQSQAAELSVQNGCLLRGSRVVVPKEGREAVISLLHEGHPGVTRMKRLSCGCVWWPGIDKELEFAVKTCAECQENQSVPARAPMHQWEWPDHPWARIPVKGKMIVVIVDFHSKWIEPHVVNSSTSQATVEQLQLVFSTHRLPEVIVSDNGTSFTSEEFAAFVHSNDIKHDERPVSPRL